MSYWCKTELLFTNKIPSPEEAKILSYWLSSFDSFPGILPSGFKENWSPSIDFELVCDLLHAYGYPCKGRQWPPEYIEYSAIPDPEWFISTGKLDQYMETWSWTLREAYIYALQFNLVEFPNNFVPRKT